MLGGDKMSQRKKSSQEPIKKVVSKKVKIISWSIVGVIFLAVIGIALWQEFKPKPKEPELPERFTNIEHISTSMYKLLLLGEETSADLSEEDKEEWKEIFDNLKHDVYVFIYNADYEASPDSEELENAIIEAYNKENKNYTLLVLNYNKNENIINEIADSAHALPNRPVLIHIEGQDVAEKGYATTVNDIRTVLAGLRES